ncbi:MAG: hypothetical protein ACP6IU_10400 [Candidatus Asgardarchaeia archaeon]|mgnify:CR=1 FL=1
MNKGRILNGFFILVIGIVIVGGLTEGEPAMLSFITQDLGFTVIQGVGLGYFLVFIGLILSIAGAVSKPSK